MKISVLLFAKAKDLVGADRTVVEVADNAKLRDLKKEFVAQHPAIAPIGHSLLWAVNNQYASDEIALTQTDAVACFPPVSGG